jgi:hypothetical protein
MILVSIVVEKSFGISKEMADTMPKTNANNKILENKVI